MSYTKRIINKQDTDVYQISVKSPTTHTKNRIWHIARFNSNTFMLCWGGHEPRFTHTLKDAITFITNRDRGVLVDEPRDYSRVIKLIEIFYKVSNCE